MPTWERKLRVVAGWLGNVVLGRDMANLEAVQTPRAAFEEFAARPRPAQAAVTPPQTPRDAGAAAEAPEKSKVAAGR